MTERNKEKGRVTRIRTREKRVRRTAHKSGPSEQAEDKEIMNLIVTAQAYLQDYI